MNKTAIRNFAIWARNKLINDVTYRAGLMGVTVNGIAKPLPQSTDNVHFYDIGMAEPFKIAGEEIKQRQSLVGIIKRKEKDSDYATAFTSVVEEVAYTWFNRLIAIRFMEVNDYLPSHIRVLSSESGKLEPDLVTTPYDAELFFANGEEKIVQNLKNENKLDEVFRMLFIKQCNALYAILPRLFENLSDYTELLLNVSFIDQDGVIYHLVHDIPEEDFNVELGGQVEIIGWLYQYYNAELKDETFALLKQNVKVTKERVPSVTQLFTPDWIVRYMVENNLGRLWINGHPNDYLKDRWKYYLDETEQEVDVHQNITDLKKKYTILNPEDIKVIDPCMGSGHVLVYAFEILMQIYDSAGWGQREAAKSIIENNIYGLDIDDRAAQLSYFAVMMKARQYNRRILSEGLECHILAIQESNTFDKNVLKRLGDLQPLGEQLIDSFRDAKEYGSVLELDVTIDDLDRLDNKLNEIDKLSDYGDLFTQYESSTLVSMLPTFINQARIMIQKYDSVVTNPPYMGSSGMNSKLQTYTKNHYPNSKSDMSTVCMERTLAMCKDSGIMSMINIPVWMFLSSYEQLRKNILKEKTFLSLVQPGRGIFGSDFGTVAFVILNQRIPNYKGHYRRLFDKQGEVQASEVRENQFLSEKGHFYKKQDGFGAIPGSPIAYWIGDDISEAFNEQRMIDVIHPKQGTSTGDDEKYVRIWHEVNMLLFSDSETSLKSALSSGKRYFPLNKGGDFRKWYGNNEKVIKMNSNDFSELLNLGNHLPSRDMYFLPGITWSKITAAKTSFRWDDAGHVFSSVGLKGFPNNEDKYYALGFLNSKVAEYFLQIISPGFSTVSGDIEKLPLKNSDEKIYVDQVVDSCVEIMKDDWDSFETSWDFKKHPLI